MYLIEDVNGIKYKVEKLSKFCEEKELTVRLIRYTNPKWKDVEGKRYQEYHKGFKIISEDIEADIVELREIEEEKIEDMPKYKEAHEISQDGTHKSDKLLRMSDEQKKDNNFLLQAHGFDTYNWELLSAKNNIWNSYSKQDGIMTLYSSKITVRPKIESFNIDWFKQQFNEIEPIKKQTIIDDSLERSLRVVEINLADLHIGINGIDYEDKLKEMITRIVLENKDCSRFILPIGQDWLNANAKVGANFTTVKGTSLQQSLSYKDMVQTGIRIAVHIVETIMINTNSSIDCIYVKGNHDEHSTFGMFCALMQRYYRHSRLSFDDSMSPRKYRQYGVNGIAFGHGEKEGNKIYTMFQVEASKIYADTKFREFHLSHLHSEHSTDRGGVLFRRLPTVNTADEWHIDNGYVGATNRIQVFVYDLEEGLESINYYNIK